MKKIAVCLFLFVCFTQLSSAQQKPIMGKSLKISVMFNDFTTAQRIRATSLQSVLRNDQVAGFDNMAAGFSVSYLQGLTPHTDLSVTAGGSFARVPLPGRRNTSNDFLLEVDASGNFKMFPETFTINPYLIAGVGASKYTNIYGAFIPLGGGIKANLFSETQFHVQLQYRVPVTPDASAHHFNISFGFSGLL